jgi:hypothetical protein
MMKITTTIWNKAKNTRKKSEKEDEIKGIFVLSCLSVKSDVNLMTQSLTGSRDEILTD